MEGLVISGLPTMTPGRCPHYAPKRTSHIRSAGCGERPLSGRRRAADNVGIFGDRLWPADQEPLDLVALFGGEELALFFRLDAFRHHRQIEPAAERDHRADDGGGLLAMAEIGDEALIDLDLVERERLQIRQRRITGAEIVHGDAHAEDS